MFQLTLWSLMVGGLGAQALMVSGWLHQRQRAIASQHEEEETLTPDEMQSHALASDAEGNGSTLRDRATPLADWEFKIVRAQRDIFREPATFKRLCEEEAQAGWILFEKLDDRRVRFKRPLAVRDIINPERLPRDPYRTHYGHTYSLATLFGAIALLIMLVLPAYLGYALVNYTLPRTAPPAAAPSPGNE